MSKQLALSIAFSVMAMSSFVLFGNDAGNAWDGAPAGYRPDLRVASGARPDFASALGQFQPVIR